MSCPLSLQKNQYVAHSQQRCLSIIAPRPRIAKWLPNTADEARCLIYPTLTPISIIQEVVSPLPSTVTRLRDDRPPVPTDSAHWVCARSPSSLQL